MIIASNGRLRVYRVLFREIVLDNNDFASKVIDPAKILHLTNFIINLSFSSNAYPLFCIFPDDPSIPSHKYTLSQEISYGPNYVASIALIKEVPSLDPARPLGTQIQITNLPGPAATESGTAGVSPYEALHSYIHHAVAPYFNAYVSTKGGNAETGKRTKQDDLKMGIPMAKRKIAELELALLHLQQNVEIPEIVLSIHSVVQEAIKKVRKKIVIYLQNRFEIGHSFVNTA